MINQWEEVIYPFKVSTTMGEQEPIRFQFQYGAINYTFHRPR